MDARLTFEEARAYLLSKPNKRKLSQELLLNIQQAEENAKFTVNVRAVNGMSAEELTFLHKELGKVEDQEHTKISYHRHSNLYTIRTGAQSMNMIAQIPQVRLITNVPKIKASAKIVTGSSAIKYNFVGQPSSDVEVGFVPKGHSAPQVRELCRK